MDYSAQIRTMDKTAPPAGAEGAKRFMIRFQQSAFDGLADLIRNGQIELIALDPCRVADFQITGTVYVAALDGSRVRGDDADVDTLDISSVGDIDLAGVIRVAKEIGLAGCGRLGGLLELRDHERSNGHLNGAGRIGEELVAAGALIVRAHAGRVIGRIDLRNELQVMSESLEL